MNPPTDNQPTPDLQLSGEPPGIMSTFEALLKSPQQIVAAISSGSGRTALNLVVTAIICLGIFGFVVGLHAMGPQLWATPAKLVVGLSVSALICFPSLYIFGCLGGLDVKLRTLAGVLIAALCLISLLLLGFAPIVWIFSQSTESPVFIGFLILAFWMIAAVFALGFLARTAGACGMAKRSYLVVWFGIFSLVALQMSTSLRPLIGSSETFLPSEKKFFLTHWFEQLSLDEQFD